MNKNQYLALWNLRMLNLQAFQVYKDLGYNNRERILPENAGDNLIMDAYHWQNLLSTKDWYEKWIDQVELRLSFFRDSSTESLLNFHKIKLNDWSDTTANRLEMQMYFIEKFIEKKLKLYKVNTLNKCYFNIKDKALFIIQSKNRKQYKVRVVDFSRSLTYSLLLAKIFELPLDHHSFNELGNTIELVNRLQSRKIYQDLKNINKKINKDLASKIEFLEIKNKSAWIDPLHI